MSHDLLGRRLTDLRISLTDKCNFRCTYCMPRHLFGVGHQFLRSNELLSDDEIVEVAAEAVALGVDKIRLTGGEPLLRPGVANLVRRIGALGDIDLAMTTNGVLLPRHARDLARAGLKRVTVSLDALDDAVFRAMSDTSFTVDQVLRGIEAVSTAGLPPAKINTVVRRGVNEHQVIDLVRHFRETGHVVRFIEFMDVGTTNGWNPTEVVPADEILDMISSKWPVVARRAARASDVARRYELADESLEFGIIASVSEPFCGSCTRLRITADGRLHTCLFSSEGLDLTSVLRGTRRNGDLRSFLDGTWRRREDQYSARRSVQGSGRASKVEMSYIGG